MITCTVHVPADAFEGFGRAFDKQCRGPPAAAVQSRRLAQWGVVVESVVGVVVEPVVGVVVGPWFDLASLHS